MPVIFRCPDKFSAEEINHQQWPKFDRTLVLKSHSDKGGWLVICWNDANERTPKSVLVATFGG